MNAYLTQIALIQPNLFVTILFAQAVVQTIIANNLVCIIRQVVI